jgi:exonuclease VII large subunit
VVVALTVAGLLITLGAAFVVSQDDDVSLWWWIPIGFALLLGLGGLAATTTSISRRRTRVRAAQPGDEAGEPVVSEEDGPPQDWERRLDDAVDRRLQPVSQKLDALDRLVQGLTARLQPDSEQRLDSAVERRLEPLSQKLQELDRQIEQLASPPQPDWEQRLGEVVEKRLEPLLDRLGDLANRIEQLRTPAAGGAPQGHPAPQGQPASDEPEDSLATLVKRIAELIARYIQEQQR